TAWIDIELAASAEHEFDRQRVGRQIQTVAGWYGAPGTRVLLRPCGEGRPDVGLRDVLAPCQWRVVGVDAGLVDVQGDRDTLRHEPTRQQHRVHADHRGNDHYDDRRVSDVAVAWDRAAAC